MCIFAVNIALSGLCLTTKQTIMKKFLTSIAILAALAIMPANAKVKFGVKGGMNSSSMKISYEDIVSRSAEGWFAGPTMQVTFPLGITNIGADAAVLYDERRTKVAFDDVDQSIKRKSIAIPVNFRANFNLIKVLGAYVATGPQFSFNLGKGYFDLTSSSSISSNFQFKKSQFSWNIGVGIIVLSHLEVGVAYNFDIGRTGELQDMSTMQIVNAPKQKSLVISAAYYF